MPKAEIESLENIRTGSEGAVRPSGQISRRDLLLKVLPASVIASMGGFEWVNQSGLRELAAKTLWMDEIEARFRGEPTQVSFGLFGAGNRLPVERILASGRVNREYNFMQWHKNLAYLDDKLNWAHQTTADGKVPGISWSPANPTNKGEFIFESTREYDQKHRSYLQTVAEKVRDSKMPLELSLLYEPNIRPVPPDKFVELFNYVVSIFREFGAFNAVFTAYFSCQFPFTLHLLPGYLSGLQGVDKLGVSGYDLYKESWLDVNHWLLGNVGPIQLLWPWLRVLFEFGGGRPVVIAECGTGRDDDYQAAQWLMGLIRLCSVVDIREVNYFEANRSHKYTGNIFQVLQTLRANNWDLSVLNLGERDWRMTRTPQRARIFHEAFRKNEAYINPSQSYRETLSSLSAMIQRDDFMTPEVHRESTRIDDINARVR